MNEDLIRERLKNDLYVSGKVITSVLQELNVKSRVSLTSQDAFIKVCHPKEKKYYKSLQNEIMIYENYTHFYVRIPELLYSYFDPENQLCIIATRKIDGQPLGTKRDAFSILPQADFSEIVKNIEHIKCFPITENWDRKFDRKVKMEEYIQKVSELLDVKLAGQIKEICRSKKNNPGLFLTHGDLIPSNIMIDCDNNFWFIDWEWATNRTKYFDIVLFTLFSDLPMNGLKKFQQIASDYTMLAEMYCDSILISLREIKNWMQVLEHSVRKNECMGYWKDVLKEAVSCLMLLW